jgi:hypothetical protein
MAGAQRDGFRADGCRARLSAYPQAGELVALSVTSDTRIALDEVDETDAVCLVNPPQAANPGSPQLQPTPPRYPAGDSDYVDPPEPSSTSGGTPVPAGVGSPLPPAGDASQFAEPSRATAAARDSNVAATPAVGGTVRSGSAGEEDPLF